MNDIISSSKMSSVFEKALKSGFLNEEDNSVIFYDLTFLENRIKGFIESFPNETLHAIAIKANPLPAILKILQKQKIGLEAASIGEVYIALKCGYSPKDIVFDSPAKTISDLKFTLEKGIHINADSFFELNRISALKKKINSSSKIGLRINPQVGEGSIEITSVGSKNSKFGVPLNEATSKIFEYFDKYEWLTGLHVHIGSQGIDIGILVESCKAIIELAQKIGPKIEWIDIGGGLPTNYSGNKQPLRLKEYVIQLRENCPQLFDGSYKIITEFGRDIHANAGWTVSRVEYVKSYSQKTVIINVGADLFLRESYQSHIWKHKFSVVDQDGKLKSSEHKETVTIAGPLCFSGDVLAKDIKLPTINQDDYILIHDSGAYNLSMWSRYNSRLIPKVIGYRNDGESFEILKEKESLEDLFNFWL